MNDFTTAQENALEDMMNGSSSNAEAFTKQVIQRIKAIRDAKTTIAVAYLNIGDRIEYEHKDQTIFGTITKIGRTRVGIRLEDGQIWNVPAGWVKVIKTPTEA